MARSLAGGGQGREGEGRREGEGWEGEGEQRAEALRDRWRVGDAGAVSGDSLGRAGEKPGKPFDPIASPTDSSLYVVSVTDASNCLSVDSVMVNVSELGIDLGPDKFICYGDSIMLNVDTQTMPGNPPYQYSWYPSTGLSQININNPIFIQIDICKF